MIPCPVQEGKEFETSFGTTPNRPGISKNTLQAAGVKFSDFPQPGSIEIPYYDINGDQTCFSRYRLPKPLADGQKYHQQPGTGVHVYFPANGVRKPESENTVGIDPQALILQEGEFKCLALHDAGLPAIGLPSLCVYTNDDNGQPQLLMDLRVAIQKWNHQASTSSATTILRQISNLRVTLRFWPRALLRLSYICHGFRSTVRKDPMISGRN